ncbi:oxygenase MpaB family protein [Gordonia sp. (in: high G+C Gram-positive bacteria)]|uniref:oxygenase MpaB family protein n=1 Tax=Gordonia sp. (in: high G+C Gram-positive bacteria) TaxID=84139 RepID=UPI0039E5FE20
MFTLADYRKTDYGFFGPDSVSWKLWTHPTALIAFQRAVVLEHFDPALTAAVADMGGIYDDPQRRLDATLAYFITVATADSKTAIEASEHLMGIHAKATGIEPLSGRRYSANNPASQLWIHVTGWHSVLKCYETYGPGPLSDDEVRRYWAEARIAAELQTCDPADVPADRNEVRAYFERVRPGLAVSERALRGMHYLLRSDHHANLRLRLASRVMAPAAIATLPRWMREMGQFDQPGVVDAGWRLPTRAAVRATSRPVAAALAIRPFSPMVSRALRAHRKAKTPIMPVVVTPTEARERYGTMGRRGATV